MSKNLLMMSSISESFWNGYLRYDFLVYGREALIILPKVISEGNPWVWRTEFFDAFAQADIAMLERGWYLAHYKVSDMYGCPDAIKLMRKFQRLVEMQFNLAKKTILFGFSRGGLYAFNYAARYPNKVSALYLDAPVLDIRSWPGGMGSGERAEKEWNECLTCYGLSEKTVLNFNENPLDKIEQVLKAAIPIIIVAGDADMVVPFNENSAILADYYSKMGGVIKIIVKSGVGHHPHSLDDPEPIIEFLIDNCKK